jgi:hypothetical protein
LEIEVLELIWVALRVDSWEGCIFFVADILGKQSSNIYSNQNTAMEIDSSDEDEKGQAGIGSVLKLSSIEVPRRMGLRSTYRRRY